MRDSPRLRGLALEAGLIPPRPMHTAAEAALLERLAAGRRAVVEIGVYEGSSAVVLARALGPQATLHLVDPYVENALREGWRGIERATRRTVARAARGAPGGGPRLRWHVAYSHDAVRGWEEPIDLLFIDGDHTEAGCRRDWEDWSPLVVPGGAVLFHDARASRPDGAGLPGPTAVVDALFRGPAAVPEWELEAEVDSAAAVRRRPA